MLSSFCFSFVTGAFTRAFPLLVLLDAWGWTPALQVTFLPLNVDVHSPCTPFFALACLHHISSLPSPPYVPHLRPSSAPLAFAFFCHPVYCLLCLAVHHVISVRLMFRGRIGFIFSVYPVVPSYLWGLFRLFFPPVTGAFPP